MWCRFAERWANQPPAPFDLTVHKGSVHVAATRGFVDYALHSRVGRHLLDWVRPTFIPDEVFFNTLSHNPHLGVPGSAAGPCALSPLIYKYMDSASLQSESAQSEASGGHIGTRICAAEVWFGEVLCLANVLAK